MANIHPACLPVSEARFNELTVRVEKVPGVQKWVAKLHIVVEKPYTREINLHGPNRDSKPEAIKDGVELGKRYVVEGEAGAKTVCLRLKKKKWTAMELKGADEKDLEGWVLPGLQGNNELVAVEQKLFPPGEGWQRHNDDMLVHPQSQVFFAQEGAKRGQYLKRSAAGAGFEDTDPPHSPLEVPLAPRSASGSLVRRGVKMDRAVLLNDITKIARLALKMPLSFVDRPACAYALFQGVRSPESAQWCAENFHKKLLPRLAEKVHAWSTEELEDLLKKTLVELDSELLRSTHAFSGCSGLIALLLGSRLVLAGVGQVRAVLLPEKGAQEPLLRCSEAGDLTSKAEADRVQRAFGVVQDGLVHASAKDLDDARRILAARSCFDVLMIDDSSPLDEKQVRSAYRKLALRVHPDKQQGDGPEIEAYQRAFARLDSSKDALEALIAEDADTSRELCRVLRSEVHTRAGAAELLGVDKAATLDTELVTQEAEKACKALIRKLGKMQVVEQASADYLLAEAICREAVETIRRGCAPEALPRHEALLREGVPTGRLMGAKDLRSPSPIVVMEPQSASWTAPAGARCRIGLLCGATAAHDDAHLASSTSRHLRQPKATALRWCLDTGASAANSSGICISLRSTREEDGPPVKKARSASSQGPEGTVRVRHILFRHQQLKNPDPMARREGKAKTVQEAEEAALRALEALLQTPGKFPQMCRELSDCQTGQQPGNLSGDLGWVAKGQADAVLEEVIFSLEPNELSDVVTSNRGLHIVQRLA